MNSCCFTIWSVVMVGATSLATPAAAELQYESEVQDDLRYIVATGQFDSTDDLQPFEALVRSSGATWIMFDSLGGNVDKAMEFGRLIRRLKMGTLQARDVECASACALAFMGGTIRVAEPGAIGVHRSSFSKEQRLSTEDAVAAIQLGTAEIVTYMAEMGIDPRLLEVSLRYDSSDMRYLSKSEMDQYRVTTAELPPQPNADPAPQASVPAPQKPPPPQIAPGSPAWSQTAGTGVDPANARRAVENAVRRYKDAGMEGLRRSSLACWQVVYQKRTLESVQYCRILDLFGTAMNEAGKKQFGPSSSTQHFEFDRRVHAVAAALYDLGVPDTNTAKSLGVIWQKQFNAAFAEQAANR